MGRIRHNVHSKKKSNGIEHDHLDRPRSLQNFFRGRTQAVLPN